MIAFVTGAVFTRHPYIAVVVNDIGAVSAFVIALSAGDPVTAGECVNFSAEQVDIACFGRLTVLRAVRAKGGGGALCAGHGALRAILDASNALCSTGISKDTRRIFQLHGQDFSAAAGSSRDTAIASLPFCVEVNTANCVFPLSSGTSTVSGGDQNSNGFFRASRESIVSGAGKDYHLRVVITASGGHIARHQLAGGSQETGCVDVHGSEERHLRFVVWVVKRDLVAWALAIQNHVRMDGTGRAVIGQHTLADVFRVGDIDKGRFRHADRLFRSMVLHGFA